MYNRSLSFVNKLSLLYKYQFGSRKGYSTNFEMITLIDKISRALDESNYVLGIFLDFNHSIFFLNSNFLGLGGLH